MHMHKSTTFSSAPRDRRQRWPTYDDDAQLTAARSQNAPLGLVHSGSCQLIVIFGFTDANGQGPTHKPPSRPKERRREIYQYPTIIVVSDFKHAFSLFAILLFSNFLHQVAFQTELEQLFAGIRLEFDWSVKRSILTELCSDWTKFDATRNYLFTVLSTLSQYH